MSEKYDHKEIEERWQRRWEEEGTFKASVDPSKEKYYVLEMFPYPSGKIHMGHVRNYSIGDVIARFLRKRGLNVFHPMGWDSFGLPAENAAIQKGVPPREWTLENIDNMRGQLKRMGLSYDWETEIATCKPDYYRWNQWFFLQMFKHEKGLAYKKTAPVNWCPDCATVLANEQVEEGRCWRCESEVEDKELDQWFFKITEYKEELLDYTKRLPGWPDRVLTSQQNWIGKSIGAEIDFQIEGADKKITVFTTRPDTLYGATFMSVAPESELAERLTVPSEKEKVDAFIKKFKQEKATKDPGQMDKEGLFTGSYCLNPLTGLKMPIYIANFVLVEYGTGAVMAVPAHDQRDFEFAKQYGLPIKVVINPKGKELDPEVMEEAYTDPGVMTASDKFDGQKNTEAKGGIIALLEEEGLGRAKENWRLRDWGISRQRYWGCPIPIIYCDDCGVVPVPETELPVLLPDKVEFSSGGLSPLESATEFVNAPCPKCGKDARRETDTMDTFVDSSWYFLRYASPKMDSAPFDTKDAEYWMPVDQYIGGIEHAVMHLLYARFFTKVVRDLGLIDIDEPFKKLLTQGMVCMETQSCEEHGYLSPDEVSAGNCVECGAKVSVGRVEKMSKSKKNTIDPDHIIKRYGADTTRLFSLFAAPPERDLDWNEDGVEGGYRFLGRVWRLVSDAEETLASTEPFDWKGGGEDGLEKSARELHRKSHETLQKVTRDIEERFHFNTAISSIMELVNSLYLFKGEGAHDNKSEAERSVFKEGVLVVLETLSPFAPHMAEELWARVGGEGQLSSHPWPESSVAAVKSEESHIVVQINGKVRSHIDVAAGSSKEEVEALAMKDEKVLEWTKDKTVRKVIYVPDKILNLVVG